MTVEDAKLIAAAIRAAVTQLSDTVPGDAGGDYVGNSLCGVAEAEAAALQVLLGETP